MPWKEIANARLSTDSAETNWVIRDEDDIAVAKVALESASPGTYNSILKRQSVDVTEMLDGNGFFGTVRYGRTGSNERPPPSPSETYRLSFNTTGGTQHITQSEGTTSYGTNPPDHSGAIGVTSEGIEGVDIGAAQLILEVTQAYNNGSQPSPSALQAITYKVNDDSFIGYTAGRLLFLGAQASQRADLTWEYRYSFAVSQQETRTIAGIAGVVVPPHHYAEIEYEQDTDDTAKKHVVAPIAVHVHEVYESATFEGPIVLVAS